MRQFDDLSRSEKEANVRQMWVTDRKTQKQTLASECVKPPLHCVTNTNCPKGEHTAPVMLEHKHFLVNISFNVRVVHPSPDHFSFIFNDEIDPHRVHSLSAPLAYTFALDTHKVSLHVFNAQTNEQLTFIFLSFMISVSLLTS